MDGKTFTNKAEAEKHEAAVLQRAKHMTYWAVSHGADLTEGRGMQAFTILEIYTPDYPDVQIWVEDFCHRTFGRRLQFIMGVSPCAGWNLRRLADVNEALRNTGRTHVLGNSNYSPRWLYLSPGPQEAGLTSKELKDYPHVAPIIAD